MDCESSDYKLLVRAYQITTDEEGTPEIELTDPGVGYALGDSPSFKEPGTNSDPVTGLITSLMTVKQLPGPHWTADETDSNLTPVGGTGSGMKVNVTG